MRGAKRGSKTTWSSCVYTPGGTLKSASTATWISTSLACPGCAASASKTTISCDSRCWTVPPGVVAPRSDTAVIDSCGALAARSLGLPRPAATSTGPCRTASAKPRLAFVETRTRKAMAPRLLDEAPGTSESVLPNALRSALPNGDSGSGSCAGRTVGGSRAVGVGEEVNIAVGDGARPGVDVAMVVGKIVAASVALAGV